MYQVKYFPVKWGLNISACVASTECLEMECTCQCLSVGVINPGRGRVTSYNSMQCYSELPRDSVKCITFLLCGEFAC